MLDKLKIDPLYIDYGGLGLPVDLCISLPFSEQIVIGKAWPASALESLGAKLPFAVVV